MTDRSYTPVLNSFEGLVEKSFPAGLTQAQKDTLQMFFFAGAAYAIGVNKENPAQLATAFDELVTMADIWEQA